MKSKGADSQALTEMFLGRLSESIGYGMGVSFKGWEVTAIECLCAYNEGEYLIHLVSEYATDEEEINILGYTMEDFLELTALFTY